MAISKVILNGETLMDVTQDTVASDSLLTGKTATKNDGTKVTGNYAVKLEPLTVKPTEEEQVFDGSPQTTEINGAMLESDKMDSGDSNTLTSSLVWKTDSDLVIGQKYHLSGWFGTGNTQETAQRIFFETDWIARETPVSIPFTTKPGYTDVQTDSFDGSIEFTEIKLSSTEITITATAPFVVFTGLNGVALDKKMYLSVSEFEGACDGYIPVTIKPMKLSTMTVYPNQYYDEIYPEPEYTDILNYSTSNDYPDGIMEEEWIEVDTSSLINGKQYIISGIARPNYVSKIFIDGTTITWNDGCTVQIGSNFTLTFENGRFKSNLPMLMIGLYIYISEPIDGWNKIEVEPAQLQSKTVSPSGSSQRVTADSGYYGLSQVTVNAISSTYVGSAIPMRSAADLIVAGKVVQTPSGYYSSIVGAIVSSAVFMSNALDIELHIGGTYFTLASSTGQINLSYPGRFIKTSIVDKNGEGYITSSMIAEGKINVTNDFFQLPTISAQTITPGSTSQYISSYQWLTGSITIEPGSSDSLIDAIATRNYHGVISGNASFIAPAAFYSNINVTGAIFPLASYISNNAFTQCTYLRSISFPSVRMIGSGAFSDCEKLLTVNCPECQWIASGAFTSCIRLSSVSFSKCTSLESDAFKFCSALMSVEFPLLTSINHRTFLNCIALSTIYAPLVTYIGQQAFDGCQGLSSVDFPLLTTLSSSAFRQCGNLTNINFPSITVIGSSAFSNCSNLSVVSLPMCQNIGMSAFYGCTNLISVYLLGSSVTSLYNKSVFLNTPLSNSTYTGSFGSIYVPASLYDAFISASNWSYYSARIVSV